VGVAETTEPLGNLRPAEQLCLLIADISGYTGYLTSTEIEHAQDVIADFIEYVIRALEPTFELIETEGDAVFVVAPVADINGQLVLDIVDACYFAFRRHLRSVVRATTCTCNACRQIATLDLKFVVHAGPAVRSTLGRRANVTGPAVIVVHRLLKNSVAKTLGPSAYLLLTRDAVERLSLDEAALVGAHLTETYEHLGEVPAIVIDMEARWQEAESAAHHRVTLESADLVIERRLPAPPPLVWDYLLDPRKRLEWQGLAKVDEQSPAGRREAGTSIHCAHGDVVFVEELLEWRPFERFTWDIVLEGYGRIRNTIVLRPDGDGTLVEDLTGPPSPEQAAEWPAYREMLQHGTETGYAALAEALAARR
jgi:uncharacterized protein YndB with AHSA1/START domain/class 3 adenylate cyclase